MHARRNRKYISTWYNHDTFQRLMINLIEGGGRYSI